MSRPVVIAMLLLAVSITLLVSGGVALWNAGIVADENNLTNDFSLSLWIPFGVGLLGFLISLPWFLATVTNSRRLKAEI